MAGDIRRKKDQDCGYRNPAGEAGDLAGAHSNHPGALEGEHCESHRSNQGRPGRASPTASGRWLALPKMPDGRWAPIPASSPEEVGVEGQVGDGREVEGHCRAHDRKADGRRAVGSVAAAAHRADDHRAGDHTGVGRRAVRMEAALGEGERRGHRSKT